MHAFEKNHWQSLLNLICIFNRTQPIIIIQIPNSLANQKHEPQIKAAEELKQ